MQTAISASTDRAKGYVRGCPRQFVNGHNRRSSPVDYVEDERACWIWQRTRNAAGYGRVRDGHKMRFAHVVWYERGHGPVPKGLMLHHTCGKGHEGCMNPHHLVPVTPAENARLSRTTKLTLVEVRRIRELIVDGRLTKRAIARSFGVSDVQVGYIARGESWADAA